MTNGNTPKRTYFQRLCTGPLKGMRTHPSAGFERLARYGLLLLRLASVQYWLISIFDDDYPKERLRRDLAVDLSVLSQLLLVTLLWWLTPPPALLIASIAAAYLLFCLYLSLVNIVFFSGVPAINKPTTSATRSLLLLAINVLHVTVTFALFYRYSLCFDPQKALFGSFLVLGTLGLPDNASTQYPVALPVQVLSNLLLLAFAVTTFITQIPLRLSKPDGGPTAGNA